MPIIANKMRLEISSNCLITTAIGAIVSKVQKILDARITKVIIFGIPDKHDIPGSET